MWTPREEVGSGMDWETEIDVYTLPCIKWITNEHLLCGSDLYSALCGDLNGKEIQNRGWGVYAYI